MRLFPTRWPDLVTIRRRPENGGTWGARRLPQAQICLTEPGSERPQGHDGFRGISPDRWGVSFSSCLAGLNAALGGCGLLFGGGLPSLGRPVTPSGTVRPPAPESLHHCGSPCVGPTCLPLTDSRTAVKAETDSPLWSWLHCTEAVPPPRA